MVAINSMWLIQLPFLQMSIVKARKAQISSHQNPDGINRQKSIAQCKSQESFPVTNDRNSRIHLFLWILLQSNFPKGTKVESLRVNKKSSFFVRNVSPSQHYLHSLLIKLNFEHSTFEGVTWSLLPNKQFLCWQKCPEIPYPG